MGIDDTQKPTYLDFRPKGPKKMVLRGKKLALLLSFSPRRPEK